MITRYIPNTLTSCNLFSGCIASTLAFQGNYQGAFTFIILGAVFDFFDGMSARLLKAPSDIGKELDSLEEGWQLKVGNQVVTRRNKELWLSDTEKATEKDIIRIINDAVHSFVDFKNMSRAELIQHLEGFKNSVI